MGLVFVVNTFVVKAIVTDKREPGSSLPTLTFAPGKCCLCVLQPELENPAQAENCLSMRLLHPAPLGEFVTVR